MTTKLILGCGYLGLRVAHRWRAAGHAVHAVTRTSQRADTLAGEGLTPHVGDVTAPTLLARLPTADTVLFAVGHDRTAGMSIEEVYVIGLTNLLAALPSPPRRFLYISTTGVYGQTAGEWVDEDARCEPSRPGGRACLAAERILAESSLADRVVVLRCAGLYGPGRIPLLDDVRRGNEIPSRPDAHVNLIHIDDAAQIVTTVDEVETSSRLFNVSDGQPIVRRDFYRELARLIGAGEPKFAPPVAGSDDRRQRVDDKRISNARMMRELRVELQYPTYREGLAAIVAPDLTAS